MRRRGDGRDGREATRSMRAMVAMTMALAVTRATGARALTKPPLNALVTARPRVISAGLDPFVEATAADWFENLGYVTLDSTTTISAGTWGGSKIGSDARLATSYCLDSTTNASVVSEYDFMGWLPVPYALEELMGTYPDAKVVLFQTMVTEWWTHVQKQAKGAAALGDTCGCNEGAVRSSSSACGDSTYHYCDIYPCMYERAFGSVTPNENAWKLKYIQRVREIKTVIPEDKLLTVPMTTAKVGHATAVKVAKVIAQFLDFTSDVDAFGETYPFIRRDLRGRSLGAVAKAWTITVIVLSVYIGFFAAKKDPARKSLRALFRRIC